MRFLIVGYGSMGRRRARCLRELGFKDIVATDSREDRRRAVAQESKVRVCADFDEALAAGADFALVCVPPHWHVHYVMRCIDAGLPVFCEAPMALNLDEADAVVQAAEATGVFVAPSCTYLHNAIHQRIKAWIDEEKFGRPLAALSHAGQHVADWHPYEDYRTFYASKRAQGGMCIDMLPHDLHLFTHFFGDARALSCMARRRSPDIEADAGACDVYDILLDMAAGVSVVIHQDMFQRPGGNYRKIMFERGAIEWNWQSLRVCEYAGAKSADTPQWQEIALENYHFEDMYLAEIRHALASLEGKESYLMPPRAERRVLELVLACEDSSSGARQVTW